MKKFLVSERSLVVILFIAVLVTFFFAHNDSKEIEEAYMAAGLNNGAVKGFYLAQNTVKETKFDFAKLQSAEVKK
jgi:hypothetical protein